LTIDAGSLLHEVAQTSLHARDISAEMLHFSSRLPPPITDGFEHRLQLLHFGEILAIALYFRERLLETLVFAVQTLQSTAQSSNLSFSFLDG
jgi:undecaprenyl pyrophosphate phosphatase UppP